MPRRGPLLLSALVLLAAGYVACRAFLVRDDAEVNGTLAFEELHHPVRILRDELGIPHIVAEDPEDLAFAFGYAEARDRLWQLDLNRHAVRGTLAEVLGPKAVDSDLFFRTVGFPRAAEASWEQASPEARRDLGAFAKGVNAYARRHPVEPLEFALLGHAFEPIDPTDCAGTAVLLAWELSLNLEDELLALKLAARVGPARLPFLMPGSPEVPLPAQAGATPRSVLPPAPAPASPPAALTLLAPLDVRLPSGNVPVAPHERGDASNNWAVGPGRTRSGKPILANDPHLPLGLPSIWYEVHLVAPGLDVAGAALPGLPYVVIGHNRHIAFGFTNVQADNQDLFVEKTNPKDPGEVLFEGRYEPLRRETAVIGVKGAPSVTKEVLSSRHGPLLNEVRPGLPAAVALSWTAHQTVGGGDALRLLDRASSWEEARDAVRHFSETCLNLVYADVDGNIGWQVTGRIPVRARGDGRFPVPGWTGEYEWTGSIPFDELPSTFLPAHGAPRATGSPLADAPGEALATANERTVRAGYPYTVSNSWAPPYRFLRVSELLAPGDRLSLEDVERIQYDRTTLFGRGFQELLAPLRPGAADARKALAILRGWDGDTPPGSSGAALFELFLVHLEREAFAAELGPEFPAFANRLGAFYSVVDALLGDSDGTYWNGLKALGGKEGILERALAAAYRDGEARLGDDPGSWRWGRLHHVHFRHALGRQPLLGLLLNRSRSLGGDSQTINNASWSPAHPFDLTWGSSYRLVVDLGDLDHAQAVNSTGESGRPFTPHYDDMIGPWAEGRYHTLWTKESDILAHRTGELELRPAPPGSSPTKGP
jgi:penicillin amidase